MKRLVASIAVSAVAVIVGAAGWSLIGDAGPAFADSSEPTNMGVMMLEEFDYGLGADFANSSTEVHVVSGVTEFTIRRPVGAPLAVTGRGVLVLEELDYGLDANFAISSPVVPAASGEFKIRGPVGPSFTTGRGVLVLEELDYGLGADFAISIPEIPIASGVSEVRFWRPSDSLTVTGRGVLVLEELDYGLGADFGN